ncbi:putative reverse transcriptase domain, reverse transcriptase zinc-binding domain protein [Tanacetum coccineum]
MHNYHRNRGPPRYAFKVDIQKAYDMVDWCFLGYILKCFGFPEIMIKWIMACVTSTSFSLSINGSIYGFFKGKHGLQQGNPLSSYLFTLVMEILTLILQRRVRMSDDFRYHKHCEELNIINVCFADDLFLFARGYVESSKGIAAALAVIVTGASQSRQHVNTSLIHLESHKLPTAGLFDVDSERISIVTVNTKEYHSNVLAIITRIMRRTLDNSL